MDSHYSLPTIEQVAAFLSRAKVFTVLDEKLDSGKSNWMNSQVTLQPLTLILGGIVGKNDIWNQQCTRGMAVENESNY